MPDVTISINQGDAPDAKEEKTQAEIARAPKDLAYKKEIYDLISKALELCKDEATDSTTEVTMHLDMALKALSYEPEADPDTEDMMKTKSDPMDKIMSEDKPEEK